jgi:membrane protein DedA with SNARE-associated domain
MHETIANLLISYGYAFLFLFVALESLGIPLPGETALVTAAAYAGTGTLSIYLVIATAAAAAIAGDNTGYWIGRKGGLPLVQRYGRYLHLNESHLEKARRFFARHGSKTVFLGRFVALLRTWAAIFAGVACMPYRVFTAYNALGGVVWATLFGTLGYAFGRNLPTLERYAGQASLALVLLVALFIALLIAARWFRENESRVEELTSSWLRRIVASAPVSTLRRKYPSLGPFFAARFRAGEYLGLHLTIGLLVSVAGLWLFGGVTEDVIHGDPLTRFDQTVLAMFRAHATGFGDSVFYGISTAGSPLTMGIIGTAVALILAVRREWINLTGWFAAYGGAALLSVVLKNAIHRPRPIGAARFLSGDSFSFPSGHAMGSLIGYGMLAYLLVLRIQSRRVRIGVLILASLLIFAIGVSRLYLGVHYFSDVVGGYAAGLLWLSVCVSGTEIARRKREVPSIRVTGEQYA